MNTLIVCLFIAAILPYLAKIPLVIDISKHQKYDNNHPRIQVSQLKGFGARAWSAHMNSFEFLTVFATAVLTALATNQVTDRVEILAITAIISRLGYLILYLMDYSTLRTLVWLVGIGCSLAILYSCM